MWSRQWLQIWRVQLTEPGCSASDKRLKMRRQCTACVFAVRAWGRPMCCLESSSLTKQASAYDGSNVTKNVLGRRAWT
eukprot:2190527-Pleurochrysis_carterae.AAC.1